jgi:hydrogenase expression/formation protein HypE
MQLDEGAIPIKSEVLGACELLGLDPLNVANEGKLVAIVPADDAEHLLTVLCRHPLGRDAMVIGEVIADPARFVRMATRIGGERIVDWLAGEQLPRIC